MHAFRLVFIKRKRGSGCRFAENGFVCHVNYVLRIVCTIWEVDDEKFQRIRKTSTATAIRVDKWARWGAGMRRECKNTTNDGKRGGVGEPNCAGL